MDSADEIRGMSESFGVFVDDAGFGEEHSAIQGHDLHIVIVGGGLHGSAYLSGASMAAMNRLCLMQMMAHEISFEEVGPPVDLFDIENIKFVPEKRSCPTSREWIDHKKRASKKTGIKSAKRAAKRRRGK